VPWKPDNASLPLEQGMERQDLPEEDRDELRRFAEFLAVQKERKAARARGEVPPPLPDAMRKYILGEGEPDG
jgi:hypothetical protein